MHADKDQADFQGSTTPSPSSKKKAKLDTVKNKTRDFSYTQNRELSWLRFNERVLEEAQDLTLPPLERLKFCSIFDSNLTEWFMIRVGGLSDLARLKRQPKDNKSNLTPGEQLAAIFKIHPQLIDSYHQTFQEVEKALIDAGITRVTSQEYTENDVHKLTKYFELHLAPILSPLVVDPRHPFPNLRNNRLYLAVELLGDEAGRLEERALGILEVPLAEKRIVVLNNSDTNLRYTLIEEVLGYFLSSCFGDYRIGQWAPVRVTRNADIDPDGEGVAEEEDYRQHMKKMLKLRQRLRPVRLELGHKLPKAFEQLILRELNLEKNRLIHHEIPLDLGYVFDLESLLATPLKSACSRPEYTPRDTQELDLSLPLKDQILKRDVLLSLPYESMTPFLKLIREAAYDPECISIKVTLYRVAQFSHLCESLIAAAEAGKEVTVLMELRARFDEANNIAWAERLEDAGCVVLYGSEGFKCHSKICLVTYHINQELKRITCLGTGNFNEKTAKLYSDFLLLTANKALGEDAQVFFKNLALGNLYGSYQHLCVAPVGLKAQVLQGIDREIEKARDGKGAKIIFKMNSLTDRDVIDKLAEAVSAGVETILIIRGICCIKPGIPEKTEGLIIRQIVGRFLEHARIYAFGSELEQIYLSSADMMTRNTERRVEIAYPLYDTAVQKKVRNFIDLQLKDTIKARELNSDGLWNKVSDKDVAPLDAQEILTRIEDLTEVPPAYTSSVETEKTSVEHTHCDSLSQEELEQTQGLVYCETPHADDRVSQNAQARSPRKEGWKLICMGLRMLFGK